MKERGEERRERRSEKGEGARSVEGREMAEW
jgi:hypothetical protein